MNPANKGIFLAMLSLLAGSLACQLLTPGSSSGSAQPVRVTDIELAMLESFPVQVQLTIRGEFADACTDVEEIRAPLLDQTFMVTIVPRTIGTANCGTAPVPFERTLLLDVVGLPAGEYTVTVQSITKTFVLTVDNQQPPTETPAPTEQGEPIGMGVRLDVPPSLATGAHIEVVPEANVEPGGPAFAMYPAYREITLDGYPLTNVFHLPRIDVYPVAETTAMNPAAADLIGRLQALLADRPTEFPDPMPFLPIFNAGQMMHTKEAYLDGAAVHGVRYLTQYAQAAYPINNHDLFYTFQGLTSDGSSYVLAILPVSHPDLPATGDEFPGGYQDFIDNYDTYLQQSLALLQAADGAEFTPMLSTLDALITSLQVE
ncbi:MAG: hypothetical protein WBR18_02995 [Anaerolineales bacterium]